MQVGIEAYRYEYHREVKRRSDNEVVLSALSAHDLARLASADKYFADEHAFSILGENISVSKASLANALNLLPADRRDIVLMSYFFDMTDKEIAESLNMAQRTVSYQRTKSLQELKKLLEGEE